MFLDPSRFKIFLCSRQIGKSFTLAASGVFKSWTRENNLTVAISTGERSAQELLLKCKNWAEAIKKLKPDKTYTANQTSIQFKNGSRIIVLPSNNASALRGYSGDLILDEFALVQKDVEIWQAIAPTITNQLAGDKSIIISSTPTGLTTQFAKIWHDGGDIWSRHKITIEDAVSQGLKVDIEQLKKVVNDPLVWNVEYMCNFVSDYADFVNLEYLDFYEEQIDSAERYIGVDVGRVNDRTAITIILKKNNVYYVDKIFTLQSVKYAEQLEFIKNLNDQYNFTAGYVDSGGIGSMLAEEIQRTVNSRIEPFTFTSTNKTPAYERVRANVSNHKMKFNKDYKMMIMNDFANIRRVISNTGKINYVAGRNTAGHSDITSSIVLALLVTHDNPASFTLPISYQNPSSFGSKRFYY